MIGFQADHQERLFYSFNLGDHVPQNYLLRGIDRHLDLSDLRQHLGDFYSHTGRPSVAPELMIRMLIIGYSLGIRSERRLYECAACSKKDRCCPNTPKRKIARSIHKDARDVARRIYRTPEYRRSPSERKKVEMLFAHLKRILKLDKLRLRGPSSAQDEFLLAATAQNLRRMAKWLTPVAQEAGMITA